MLYDVTIFFGYKRQTIFVLIIYSHTHSVYSIRLINRLRSFNSCGIFDVMLSVVNIQMIITIKERNYSSHQSIAHIHTRHTKTPIERVKVLVVHSYLTNQTIDPTQVLEC